MLGQDGRQLAGREPLGQLGEPADIGEEDGDLALVLELHPLVLSQPVHHARGDERPQGLGLGLALHDRRVELLDLIDGRRRAATRFGGELPEELRDLPVHGLLGGRELPRHVGVGQAARHHPEDPRVLLAGLVSIGEACGDGRIDARPALGHLLDGEDQFLPLRDPVFEEVGQAAVQSKQKQGHFYHSPASAAQQRRQKQGDQQH